MHNRMVVTFFLLAANCLAARLSPSAERAFESYVANVEARLTRQHAGPETYLAVLTTDAGEGNRLERKHISGDTQVESVNGGTWPVDRALMHHWRAATLVPKATARDMLALLRDFNHLSSHYAPQVVSSSALVDDGDTATLAMRLKERKVFTIVLDAEYKFESKLSGGDRGYSISRSTHIWQVDNPGTARENRRPEGDDDGFLWRLNSYWSFAQTRQGLQMEREAISLTRNVPPGLGWLITPIIGELPREALEFTLKATKRALTVNLDREAR